MEVSAPQRRNAALRLWLVLFFVVRVWYHFGSDCGFRKPVLRLARDLCVTNIFIVTILMTTANLVYLVISLFSAKQSSASRLLYLTLALVPFATLLANEYFFGNFAVE
jgi:hypothetical protein